MIATTFRARIGFDMEIPGSSVFERLVVPQDVVRREM